MGEVNDFMRYEERVLAFFDVLGFEKAVENTIKKTDGNEIEVLHEIQKIESLLNEVHLHLNYLGWLSGEPKIKGRVVSQFSDSIVISYLKDSYIHHILHDIYFLSVMALEKGFLFRGAIICGKVIHTDKIIFGPAFNTAYEMEQRLAVYPRIILEDTILKLAETNYLGCSNPNAEYESLKTILLTDFDGLHFINYIDKLETGVDCGLDRKLEHYGYIEKIMNDMEKIKKSSVRSKYLWLKEKYDFRLDIFNSNYRNNH